jgi:hypothetical protein
MRLPSGGGILFSLCDGFWPADVWGRITGSEAKDTVCGGVLGVFDESAGGVCESAKGAPKVAGSDTPHLQNWTACRP